MLRFKDLPEYIESLIIGRQPPRRSLISTPVPSVAPSARSTLFRTAEEEESMDINKSPTKKGLELKPRRLQGTETSETIAVGSTPFSSSLIVVAIPYIDPP